MPTAWRLDRRSGHGQRSQCEPGAPLDRRSPAARRCSLGACRSGARAQAPFSSTEDLVSRAQLGTREINALAAADALRPLAGHRRQQVWEASAIQPAPALLKAVPTHETPLVLPETPEGENILFDYQSTGLTLRRHPLALLRPRLARRGLLSAGELNALPNGREVAACGIVTVRQQPQTAKGTIFVTLEDETGPVNVIVWKSLRDTPRHEVLHARLLAVYGVWQRSEERKVTAPCATWWHSASKT